MTRATYQRAASLETGTKIMIGGWSYNVTGFGDPTGRTRHLHVTRNADGLKFVLHADPDAGIEIASPYLTDLHGSAAEPPYLADLPGQPDMNHYRDGPAIEGIVTRVVCRDRDGRPSCVTVEDDASSRQGSSLLTVLCALTPAALMCWSFGAVVEIDSPAWVKLVVGALATALCCQAVKILTRRSEAKTKTQSGPTP